jgi:hypothetical protein
MKNVRNYLAVCGATLLGKVSDPQTGGFAQYMQPQSSSPCSQQPATCPYTESCQCSSPPRVLFL